MALLNIRVPARLAKKVLPSYGFDRFSVRRAWKRLLPSKHKHPYIEGDPTRAQCRGMNRAASRRKARGRSRLGWSQD